MSTLQATTKKKRQLKHVDGRPEERIKDERHGSNVTTPLESGCWRWYWHIARAKNQVQEQLYKPAWVRLIFNQCLLKHLIKRKGFRGCKRALVMERIAQRHSLRTSWNCANWWIWIKVLRPPVATVVPHVSLQQLPATTPCCSLAGTDSLVFDFR